MRRLKDYWRPEAGIFLIVWLALLFAGRSRLFRDPGTFWHTAVGEHILSTGTLIHADHYSFSHAGRHWIAHQWLGECLMALIYRVSQLDGLLLVTATVLAGLYTWIGHRLIRSGLHWSLAGFFLAVTVAAGSFHFHVRPHVATIVLLAVTFGWLCDFEAGRVVGRRLLWLVPLFVLWTNFHGGVLAGMGVLGLTVAGWFALVVIGKGPLQGGRDALFSIGLVAACLLTALVNPYGLEMPRAWLWIMRAELPSLIEEHAPLNPFQLEGLCVLALGAVYLFTLLGLSPCRPRVTWLIPLVMFYLACTRVRHGPLFGVTAAIALADMFPQTRWANWLVRKGSDLFQPPAADQPPNRRWDWRPALLPASVLLVAVVLHVTAVEAPVIGRGWVRLEADYWPVELLDALEREGRQDDKIFNEYQFGGLLILYTPGLKVFIDDRCELYGYEFLVANHRAEQENPRQIEAWADEYGFRLALVKTGSGFDKYLKQTPGWTLIQTSEAATLYRRSSNSQTRP